MSTLTPSVHGVRYPAFEMFYDRQKEGTKAIRRRIGLEPTPRLRPSRPGPISKKERYARRKAAAITAFTKEVHRKPGRNLQAIANDIAYLFESPDNAKRMISTWLRAGEIKGVRSERGKKFVLVWPAEATAAGE